MSYTALYRRFRPDVFADLVGQEHISRTLTNAVKKENFVHAYLFCGPRGTGKTSTAKILAKAVNCLDNKNGEPCGNCLACLRIASAESLDIMEIDAASNRGIDEIRDLRERVKYAPAQEKYKVYIIDEVHMLTGEAFNALLKTLEEPPAHVVFILATTEPHKIPLTVLSRCQRFDFHRIGMQDMINRLAYIAQEEEISIDEEALILIAKKAEGGLRDGVNLLDQCRGFAEGTIDVHIVAQILGCVDKDFIEEFAYNLLSADIVAVLEQIEQLAFSGNDFRQFLYDILDYLRTLFLESLSHGGKELPAWAESVAGDKILGAIQILGDSDNRLRNSLQPRITLELALMQICNLFAQESGVSGNKASALLSRSQKRGDVLPKPKISPSIKTKQSKEKFIFKEEKAEKKSAEATEKIVLDDKSQVEQGEEIIGKDETEEVVEFGLQDKPQVEEDQLLVSEENVVVEEEKDVLNIEKIKFLWPKFLKNLTKVDNNSTVSFLQWGKPIALEGNKLILGFEPDFELHMNTVCNKSIHRHLIEEQLKQIFACPLVLAGVLIEALPKSPQEEVQDSLF